MLSLRLRAGLDTGTLDTCPAEDGVIPRPDARGVAPRPRRRVSRIGAGGVDEIWRSPSKWGLVVVAGQGSCGLDASKGSAGEARARAGAVAIGRQTGCSCGRYRPVLERTVGAVVMAPEPKTRYLRLRGPSGTADVGRPVLCLR